MTGVTGVRGGVVADTVADLDPSPSMLWAWTA